MLPARLPGGDGTVCPRGTPSCSGDMGMLRPCQSLPKYGGGGGRPLLMSRATQEAREQAGSVALAVQAPFALCPFLAPPGR